MLLDQNASGLKLNVRVLTTLGFCSFSDSESITLFLSAATFGIYYLFILFYNFCTVFGVDVEVQSINSKHYFTRIVYQKFHIILYTTANIIFLTIRFNFISALFKHFHSLSHLNICQSPLGSI